MFNLQDLSLNLAECTQGSCVAGSHPECPQVTCAGSSHPECPQATCAGSSHPECPLTTCAGSSHPGPNPHQDEGCAGATCIASNQHERNSLGSYHAGLELLRAQLRGSLD